MKTPSGQPLHRVLPVDAQLDLMAASQVPVTRADPLARLKAIEKATQRAQRNHPYLFKKGL